MNKKIVLTASRFYPYAFGGGEVYIASVAAELRRRKWNVQIVTLGNTQESIAPYSIERYSHNGIPVSALCFHRDTLTELEKYSGISRHHLAFLRSEIENFAPDIIHINGISLPALTVAKEKNIPAVTTVHHSGVVCPAGDLVRPDNSLCTFAESPHVCIPCTSLIREPQWYTGGIFGRIPRVVYSTVGKRTENTRDLPFALRVVRYPWLVDQEIVHNKKMWEMAGTVIFFAML
ncbi:MAG: glycosyltransferase [Ignavibacteriales bacterium]|nr:glycosyltransferase [Ignavibacteriales bacterium]